MEESSIFRLVYIALLLGVALISGYFLNNARQESARRALGQEGSVILALRFGLGLPLLLSLALIALAPERMLWASSPLPSGLRWLGAGLGVLSLLLMVWVFRSLGGSVTETVLPKSGATLVQGGPYRWVRHPLYASALLLVLSLGLAAANWLLVGFALVGVLVFRLLVIPIEEANLIQAYGQAYEGYRQRTGALFPLLLYTGSPATNALVQVGLRIKNFIEKRKG